MQVSAPSRMTSYSISCQPDKIALDHDLADGAEAQAGAHALLEGLDRVDDATARATEREGRPHDGRQADVVEGPRRGSGALRFGRTLDDGGGRVGLADAVEEVAETLAVLGHLDGRDGRSQEARAVALQQAGAGDLDGQVQTGLAAQAGEQPVGALSLKDALDRSDRERLEVDDVGHARVGHDRGRVGVEEDRAHALLAQGSAGLRAGIVELGGLADDDRARAQDEDRARARELAGSPGSPRPQALSRHRSPARRDMTQEAVEDLGRVERAR